MRFLLGAPGSAPRLAVATNSEQLKIFSRDSLHCQLLHGHSRVILSLDSFFAPPPLPPLLVTSSKDRTVRVWGEVEGSQGQGSEFVCKGVGSGHTEAVGAVAIARFAVTPSHHHTCLLTHHHTSHMSPHTPSHITHVSSHTITHHTCLLTHHHTSHRSQKSRSS